MLRVNFYARVTRAYFARKSAILHAFYARVGAAIPVASTVSMLKVRCDYHQFSLLNFPHTAILDVMTSHSCRYCQ